MAKSVTFNITAVDKVTNVLKKIDGSVTKSTKGLSIMRSGMKVVGIASAAMGAAAAAAGSAIAGLTSKGLAQIDVIAKTADKLSIGTEALVGFQHAAGLAGVGTKALETGLAKMADTVADAAGGMAAPALAFRDLKLDAEEVLKLPIDQQFKLIAEEISKVDNAAKKIQLARDIFGRAGTDLIPLLNSGAKGLADMQKEAEALNLTFSRIDARTVEEANDAMARAGSAITGLENQLAIKLAPAITAVSNELINLQKDSDFIGQFAEWTKKLALTFFELPTSINGGTKSLQKFNKEFGGIEVFILGIKKAGLEIEKLGHKVDLVYNSVKAGAANAVAFVLKQLKTVSGSMVGGPWSMISMAVDTDSVIKGADQAAAEFTEWGVQSQLAIDGVDDRIASLTKTTEDNAKKQVAALAAAWGPEGPLAENQVMANYSPEEIAKLWGPEGPLLPPGPMERPSNGLLADDVQAGLDADIAESAARSTKALKEYGTEMAVVVGSAEDLRQKLNELNEDQARLMPGSERWQELGAEIATTALALEDVERQTNSFADAQRAAMTANTGAGRTLQGIEDALSKVNAELKNLEIGSEAYKVAQRKVSELENEHSKAMGEMSDGMQAFASEATSAIDQFVETGKFSIRSFALDVLQQFAKMQIQAAIFGKTWGDDGKIGAGSILGIAGSILGGFGGAASGAGAASVPSMDGGGFTGYGSRSGGADGKGGFMAMLHPNETVIDHTKGQGMGGISFSQTVNIQPGMSTEMIPQIMQATQQAVMSGLAEIAGRGGSRAQGMGLARG